MFLILRIGAALWTGTALAARRILPIVLPHAPHLVRACPCWARLDRAERGVGVLRAMPVMKLMKPRQAGRQAEPTAVLHEREAMEDAVRRLVEEGVRAQRIRISQGSIRDGVVRTAPESGSVLAFGVAIGAVTGAALALAWTYWLSALVAELPLVVLRTLSGAASGALIGALLTVVVFAAHRKVGDELDAQAGDFVVTVKAPNESAADDVREVLALRGGNLVPVSP
jgi:hypothetical protein